MPTVEVNAQTKARLRQLQAATACEPDALLEEAVKQLHRSWMGRDDGGPAISTGPFRKVAHDRWAEVVIRQVDPKRFDLVEPFRYCKDDRTIMVPANVRVTDLASVPRLLIWLVPRYGRHSLAALLHDHLQHVDDVTPEEADTIFRDSMGDTGVPLIRRWLMWAAVTLRSRLKFGGNTFMRIAIGAYASVFFAAGLIAWPYIAIRLLTGGLTLPGAVLWTSVLLLSPLVACWIWFRMWRFGLLTAASLVIIVFPTALLCVVLGLYIFLEACGKFIDKNPQPIFTRNLSGDSTAQGNPREEDF